jgi:hypothetical protein
MPRADDLEGSGGPPTVGIVERKMYCSAIFQALSRSRALWRTVRVRTASTTTGETVQTNQSNSKPLSIYLDPSSICPKVPLPLSENNLTFSPAAPTFDGSMSQGNHVTKSPLRLGPRWTACFRARSPHQKKVDRRPLLVTRYTIRFTQTGSFRSQPPRCDPHQRRPSSPPRQRRSNNA